MTSVSAAPHFDFSRSLLEHSVSPATAKAYRSGYNVFIRFLFYYFRITPSSLSPVNLDFYFCEFVSYMWRKHSGGHRQLCVNAKHGILFVIGYHLKDCFPRANRCLITWKRRQPVVSALPIPQRWLDIMCFLLSRRGYWRHAAGLLLAFGGCLRVSELLGLHGLDVLVPDDPRQSGSAVGLRLRKTKTGPNKFARIRDPLLVPLLRFLKVITPPESLIFEGISNYTLNKLLGWCSTVLRLDVRFTMHSLRHGAAVKRFLDGDSPDLIRLEGRWSALYTMETYLQTCASLLLSFQCPPRLVDVLSAGPCVRKRFLHFF